jgi:hypothetical protein
MKKQQTISARSDAATDPSVAPVGPLIPNDSADAELDDEGPERREPIVYDAEEYRWVPVRRRPRFDGWTEEKQRRFIEALADTGLVSHAAKAVGMTRESANRLRRSPHGAAFARAWDAARLHAGSALEDIAFERAIEGQERNVYNEFGEVICTKRVVNDRMLTFLLSHLMPDRYGKAGRGAAMETVAGPDSNNSQLPPPTALEASLRAMEPELPAQPEEILDAETLEAEIQIAEIMDGTLPHFLSEQCAPKSDEQLEAEKITARHERGRVAREKSLRREKLSRDEFSDMCHYLDPTYRFNKGRKRYR